MDLIREALRRFRIFVRNLLGIKPRPLDRDNDGYDGGSLPRG